MPLVMALYLTFVLLLAAVLAASGFRHPLRASLAVVALAFLGWAAVLTLPGTPKPARVEMLATLDHAEVLWFAGSEADGISIVLAGPRLYGLPWSEQTMRALHEASQAAEGQGGTVVLRRGSDGAGGGEWSADHVPAPEPEPKS